MKLNGEMCWSTIRPHKMWVRNKPRQYQNPDIYGCFSSQRQQLQLNAPTDVPTNRSVNIHLEGWRLSYLEGYWVQLPWPSCPLHSGSGQKVDTAPPSQQLPPDCEMDLLAARGSSPCKLCDCWCQTHTELPPSGPWPDSTCGQGWC